MKGDYLRKYLLTLLFCIAMSGTAHAQQTVSGNLSAATADCITAPCVVLAVPSTSGAVTINLSGTWSATAQFEGVGPAGTPYVALLATPSNSATTASSATANGTWQVNAAGYSLVRVRPSAYTSGTIIATLQYSLASARGGGGGGSGSGTVSGQANGVIPLATAATTIGAQSLATDSGTTLAYTGTGGVNASAGPVASGSDGVHAGEISLPGNTTVPAIPANSFAWLAPNSASFTSYAIQCPATAPAASTIMLLATTASNVSACTFPGVTGTGMGVLGTNPTFPAGITVTNNVSAGSVSASGGSITAGLYDTATNCAAAGTAANPSLVACGFAIAGHFSCATNASTGTCVVADLNVTANSEVLLTEDSSVGGLLSVTCNAGLVTAFVSAKTGGTSFTLQLGSFSTNPVCFGYTIVN